MHTRAPHLHPVRELSGAGEPPLIAGAAYCCLQLLMTYKPCEQRQVNRALCPCHLLLLLSCHVTLPGSRAVTAPQRVIKARRGALTVLLGACLIRL